jgi:hypothetical protein
MNSTKRTIVAGSLLSVCILACLWVAIGFKGRDIFARRQDAGVHAEATSISALGQGLPSAIEAPTATEREEKSAVVDRLSKMLTTPIDFHGRVVDQFGDSVPNAEVGYSLLDKLFASGSGGTTKADAQGVIHISNVKGDILGVNVRKTGYYHIHNVSKQRFAFGSAPDGSTKPPPTPESPAVFILHKMGSTVPLIFAENKAFKVPRDGTAVRVDLARRCLSESGELVVQAWTEAREPGAGRRCDWTCRVSIPGGGLVERTVSFEFAAPESGYREMDEVSCSRAAERWLPGFERQYFVRTPERKYARIKFWFTTGGIHYFEVETHINPVVGERNLEYEDAKRIDPYKI